MRAKTRELQALLDQALAGKAEMHAGARAAGEASDH